MRHTVFRHCSRSAQHVPKAVYHSGCQDKLNCPWRDLIPRFTYYSIGHHLLASVFLHLSVDGYWTTRGYANSRTGRLADWSTSGLDNSRTGQVADWITRGCHRRLCVLSFRSIGGICETTRCPVRELAYPQVVLLPSGLLSEGAWLTAVRCITQKVITDLSETCRHVVYTAST